MQGGHPHFMGAGAWDRYAYVNNSPVMYTNPTGHAYCDFINNNNAEDCNGGLANSQSSGGSSTKPPASSPQAEEDSLVNPDHCKKFGECDNTQKPLVGPNLPFDYPDPQYLCETFVSGAPLFCDSRAVRSTFNGIGSSFNNIFASPDPFSMLFDVSNVRGWTPVKIPGVIGFGMEYSMQLSRDKGQGFSGAENHLRALTVAGEGQVISIISLQASGLSALGSTPTGPGVVVVATSAYVASSSALSSLAASLNEDIVFPMIHSMFD